MSVWRLIVREIWYRKLNFSLGVLSVVVAVGCLVGELGLLRQHDLETERLVAQKEAETQARMDAVQRETQERMEQFEARTAAAMQKLEEDTAERMRLLEDDYRKITKNLGFNILILPKDQNLSDLYADDFASKYMPEEYANRLARSKIATINHLLPSLQEKVKWPEQERTIILFGTRGEVPLLSAEGKKPILDPVPPGTMVLGSELHRSLKLKEGDRVRLLGRDFSVYKLHPERGNKDDITIFINLREAQDLLNRPGQINALLALECNCADPNRLQTIREEIAAILPDTQVLEYSSQALARAEARNRARKAAEDELASAAAQSAEARRRNTDLAEQERAQTAAWAAETIAAQKAGRAQLRQQQEEFAAWLVPLVLLGCAVWVGLLAFSNVRDRSVEIGILRALGLRQRQVLMLVLGKAVLIGLLGAAAGVLVGLVIPAVLTGSGGGADSMNGSWLLLVVAGAPALCGVASWLPAILATRQDPAVILREA